MDPVVYRGGPDLTVKRHEVRLDRLTGLVKPIRGISVHVDPAKLARFGGAFRVESIPPGLKVEQVGGDPGHHEIMPAFEMTLEQYRQLLDQVVLKPA